MTRIAYPATTAVTMSAPSMLVSASLVPREPTLEGREREVLGVHRPIGLAGQVDRRRCPVDKWREVRADRRRQLRRIAEVGRDVGEVLDGIGVIALAQERARDPLVISRE